MNVFVVDAWVQTPADGWPIVEVWSEKAAAERSLEAHREKWTAKPDHQFHGQVVARRVRGRL
jgi:hypothetical protein